jgi:hypothetical protein
MALNKEVWINQIKEGFYPNDLFLQKAIDFSGLVDNNKLHFPSAGIDPNVLINNTTYPIKIVKRDDDDNEISLVKFETENTLVRRPDVIEYSYDQLESVIRQHRETLRATVAAKAAHAYAPQQDTLYTPTINTTGENYNGRKRLTFDDILSLKEKFDTAKIPLEKRYLVLHPSHVTDLLKADIKLFKELTNIVEGEPVKFAGFGCFAFPEMPLFDLSTLEKLPFATKPGTGKGFASVAFQAEEVMKADGEIYMYSRIDDPEERATVVGFDKRFVALPIRNKGIGAIISSAE